ncbi:MAG: thiamine biosynthesis protein ApbE [SAR86 cluster bacterium]|uniref:FAD:protein FMN transferase n=1 Tax=SAR86 cluster bacterium TaxID=2030880 RepID=A0A2A5AF20_9GAMM|nr:MAG: thiamine biosynthesis protein ApbE [SAR86 cluster bacterium]
MDQSIKRFSFKAMGSFCEVQLYAKSRIDAKQVVKSIAAEIARLEKKYSRFRDDSFVTDINVSASQRLGVKIDTETKALFDHALTCFEQSNGLFDITAGVLNYIWDFSSNKVPSQAEIDQILPLIGFSKLSFKRSRLYMPANMQIDFGGIVKEYAADSAAKIARGLGVQHGLVNLGGDFAVIGPQPGNQPWTIGVANPKEDKSLMAKIDLLEGGLASSGDYERFFMHDGKRYSHILNPKTGWPCAGLRAVSVAANLCTVAGSVATIAMVREESEGINWLKESSLPHVYMDSEENIGGVGLKT